MQPVNESDLDWTEGNGNPGFRRKQFAEALYGLDGTGSVRCPHGEHDVEPGNYPANPANPDGAHQVMNDSDDPLRYFVFSPMNDPHVTLSVEADALGVYQGRAPRSHKDREYTGYVLESDSVD